MKVTNTLIALVQRTNMNCESRM